MANRVLILRWAGSAYDSLGGLLELTGHELAALGYEVTIVSADGEGWTQRLIQLLRQGGISFALTMSGIGTDLSLDGRLVWEAAKVPLFNWSCDHPCYFPMRHAIRSAYLLHGYVFPDHARYNIEHLSPNGSAFAVHLGIPPRSIFLGAPLQPSERNGRLMFTKSGSDINKIEAVWREYSSAPQQIVFAAAEELLACSTADFLPTIQRIAEPLGLFVDGNNQLTMLLMREIDAYIRFKRANLVMNAILRYPVDVFGTGWEHINWDGAAARCHGAMTWRRMIDQLPSYVGSLSVNPLINESVHDRVFFALAAGVVPVSDGNPFADENLPALGSYRFTFDGQQIEQAVEAALSDPADAFARVEETWRALATPFGMRRSAQQIAQFAALHPLNAPFGH